MEKVLKPMSGYLALVICLVLFVGSVYLFITGADSENVTNIVLAVVC